jgi:uncharacterized protein (TIGR00725 family)
MNSENHRRTIATDPFPNRRKPGSRPSNEPSPPLISVFGSAQARRGGKLYAESKRMGELLGRAGFDLMTGGYDGVMEAVSHGASEVGAHVIGVTLGRFGSVVNPFVMTEIPTTSFYERFKWLIDHADGYVAMHGGIGTLAEVVFAWQESVLQEDSARPLVLVGERWRRLYRVFRDNLIAPSRTFERLTIVATPEAAMKVLSAHFARSRFKLKARERLAPGDSRSAGFR